MGGWLDGHTGNTGITSGARDIQGLRCLHDPLVSLGGREGGSSMECSGELAVGSQGLLYFLSTRPLGFFVNFPGSVENGERDVVGLIIPLDTSSRGFARSVPACI